MKTDIRLMIEGLRPVADFQEHVERTIVVLGEVAKQATHPAELAELEDLSAFWTHVLEGMRS
jgi:hypothetical protein